MIGVSPHMFGRMIGVHDRPALPPPPLRKEAGDLTIKARNLELCGASTWRRQARLYALSTAHLEGWTRTGPPPARPPPPDVSRRSGSHAVLPNPIIEVDFPTVRSQTAHATVRNRAAAQRVGSATGRERGASLDRQHHGAGNASRVTAGSVGNGRELTDSAARRQRHGPGNASRVTGRERGQRPGVDRQRGTSAAPRARNASRVIGRERGQPAGS